MIDNCSCHRSNKMKIIAVGDVHGRDDWKRIAEKESDFDQFVFVGDYFDAWHPMTSIRIIENFKDILKFKEEQGNKVILCMGNHDFQYMPASGGTEQYSGYDPLTQARLDDMGEWWKPLQPAYGYNDILFTHAGLTRAWAEKAGINPIKVDGAAVQICDAFKRSPELFKFFKGDTSRCGEHTHQGPFWVRPKSLAEDPYPGLRMVVGHTHTEGVSTKGAITMVDTGKDGEYLKIIDGALIAESL